MVFIVRDTLMYSTLYVLSLQNKTKQTNIHKKWVRESGEIGLSSAAPELMLYLNTVYVY